MDSLQEEKDGGRSENEEVGDDNWSHAAVLEFFKVVADFFKWEEERSGLLGEYGQRSRISNMAASRKRSATVMRRQRQHTHELSTYSKEENYTWKGSYTH